MAMQIECGGIYAITRRASGETYIGSAKSFKRRWATHRNELAKGKHHSYRLQEACDQYGADAFDFIMLEFVDEDTMLIVREQHYIDTLHPHYNIVPTAGSLLGHRFRPESKAKISKALAGKPLDPERAARIAARNQTPAQKAAVSRSRKGMPPPQKGWQNTYMTEGEFIAAYPTMPSKEIAAFCHVSQAAICVWAKRLGLPRRYKDGGTGLLKPRTPLAQGAWGPGREKCADCRTTDYPYKGNGVCVSCYSRRRTLAKNPDAEQRNHRRRPR